MYAKFKEGSYAFSGLISSGVSLNQKSFPNPISVEICSGFKILSPLGRAI